MSQARYTGIFIPLVLCSVGFADTTSISVPPGLAELKITFADGVDVTWETKQPTFIQHRIYETKKNESVFVFHAVEGQSYVVVCDVIDWDNRDRTRTDWLVTVGPRGPPDVPVPPPVDPVDPERSAFSMEIRDLTSEMNLPSEAREIATNFRTVGSQIKAGGISTQEAAAAKIERLNAATPTNSKWNKFGLRVGRELNEARSLEEVAKVFDEIVQGMEASNGY